jgi:hypothetical protein
MRGINIFDFWEQAFLEASERDSRMGDDGLEEVFWQKYAPDYEARSPLAERAARIIELVRGRIHSARSALEIGPGTGAFSRKLFQSMEKLTLVEPSEAMRRNFEKAWPLSAVTPEWIASRWEDALAPINDIVFASNAVYRIRRIDTALEEMLNCARHNLFLIQTAGEPYAPPLKVHDGGKLRTLPRWVALQQALSAFGSPPGVFRLPITPPEGSEYEVVLLTVHIK